MSLIRKYRLIISTGLVVLGIRIALHLVSLRRLLYWLSYVPVSVGEGEAVIEDTAYYTDRWLTMFPYNPKGNCFPRALTLFLFSRRAGLPVEFNCGVMKLNQHLEGHAWLMLNGRQFFEPSSYWQSFTVTLKFPQPQVVSSD